MSLESSLKENISKKHEVEAEQIIKRFIKPEQLVGDLYSIGYEYANIMIHDHYRQKVGGIPSLSFLIATRLNPENCSNIDFKAEDTSFILLRVMDSAPLPQDKEAERIRVETAQRVSGEVEKNWDAPDSMDLKTRSLLGYAGVKCRIIGTFFLDTSSIDKEAPLTLKFGSDISNYYPNRGLKVYKPNGESLEMIVNYFDVTNTDKKFEPVKIGHVRYASTNRSYQNIDNVEVKINPNDMLSQKSALFGMTRTGKSNTTKIISKAVFELRNKFENGKRIGQIIFDPNGEYANDNEQDSSSKTNPSSLKNVWKLIPKAQKENEVVTYGITPHPNDPDRKLMLINFFLDENLQIGKDIIDSLLAEDTANYVKFFTQVTLEKPDDYDENNSAKIRYERKVLAYRAILAKAGFKSSFSTIRTKSSFGSPLFNKELLEKMSKSSSENTNEYLQASKIFGKSEAKLDELSIAFESLEKFIRENKEYKDFENDYINGHGHTWADDDFKKMIGILQYPSGTRRIGKALPQHSCDTSGDYADDIYEDLQAGKLVIIDQSSGEPELNKSSAKRVATKIFRKNQEMFIKGRTDIPEILIYIEEAHNILPSGNDLDTSDIWVRTAKEGAKYHIGMVYATQEVSSIQKNILKNTANWFISHLNNTDETKELCKYYDFIDFEPSIRRAQDKGFLRIKTLSNLFVIPVQVDKFEIPEVSE